MALSGLNARATVAGNNILGLNEASITINGELMDVTTFASGGWIEKIAGLKSAEISLSGFYLSDDTTGQTVLHTALLNGTAVTMEVLYDGTHGWTGSFLLSNFDMSAQVASTISSKLSLESTGAITAV